MMVGKRFVDRLLLRDVSLVVESQPTPLQLLSSGLWIPGSISGNDCLRIELTTQRQFLSEVPLRGGFYH
jgi:hypothetical protein